METKVCATSLRESGVGPLFLDAVLFVVKVRASIQGENDHFYKKVPALERSNSRFDSAKRVHPEDADPSRFGAPPRDEAP